MSETTPLDQAHAAMEAAPADDTLRLRFFERLADAELFLLLTEEATGETLSPEVFDLADGRFVLVFDREERLAQFVGQPAPYAAVSGRVIVSMLAHQGMGLGLNIEVAPSAMLLPAEGLNWLEETLGHAPDAVEAEIAGMHPPAGVPESLLTALDTKLATAAGLAQAAYLVGIDYKVGGQGHLLAFVGAEPAAEDALAKAVSEVLTFSGIEAGALDVGFFAADAPLMEPLTRAGLRFDLPQPAPSARADRPAPGSDPEKPPILR